MLDLSFIVYPPIILLFPEENVAAEKVQPSVPEPVPGTENIAVNKTDQVPAPMELGF